MQGYDLVRWRKTHRIKQSALAEMLGVSQATVSKWEKAEIPFSKATLTRLHAVMSGVHDGKLRVELACMEPLQQVKLLVRGRGAQIIGMSAGFRQLWPGMCEFIGANTRDMLVNEAAAYCEEHDYLKEAEEGELLMVTGVSNRLLSVGDPVDETHRVRWHAIVRHIDGEMLHEMIYEPCAADTQVGFERILRRSDVLKRYE